MEHRTTVLMRVLIALACVIGLGGCFSTSEPQVDVQDDLARGKLASAIQHLEKSSEVDPVLKLLEKAQLEHYAGSWEESNTTFEEAEKIVVELYDRSLEDDGPAMITNDGELPYRVRAFEIAMVPYYKAFNLLALDNLEGARAEAKRANRLLEISTEIFFREAAGDPRPAVDILRRSGFAHYLIGLLSEADGALDEAFVEYQLALIDFHETWSAMRVPILVWLGDDLVRVGEKLGYWTELEEIERDYPGLFAPKGPPGGPSEEVGTLALFVEVGWVASLDARIMTVPILETDDLKDVSRLAEETAVRFKSGWGSAAAVKTRLQVTVPTIVQHWAGAPTRVELEVEGEGKSFTVISAVVDDLEQRAGLTFLARVPTVVRETMETALAEYSEAGSLRKSPGVVRVPTFRAGDTAEMVDTRGWVTLPKVITLIRVDLPPAVYDFVLEYRDDWGTVISRERLDDVEITAGEFSFFSRRVF